MVLAPTISGPNGLKGLDALFRDIIAAPAAGK
jgi:hypothetical protein